MRGRRVPERTCVGCRGRGPKTEFVRVVRSHDGRVAVDRTGRAPGRGAYLHPSSDCLRRAARGGRLARALRVSLPPREVARLVEELSDGVGEAR